MKQKAEMHIGEGTGSRARKLCAPCFHHIRGSGPSCSCSIQEVGLADCWREEATISPSHQPDPLPVIICTDQISHSMPERISLLFGTAKISLHGRGYSAGQCWIPYWHYVCWQLYGICLLVLCIIFIVLLRGKQVRFEKTEGRNAYGECKPQIAQSSTRVATKLSGSQSSESMPTHILSQSYDQFLTSAAGVYDDSTLKGMWTKAGTLVSTPNMILPIPGKAGSRDVWLPARQERLLM